MIHRNCIGCNAEFIVVKWSRKKYCSMSCFGRINKPKGSIPWNKNLKGLHLSPSTEFKKGVIPKNSMVFKPSPTSFKGTLAEYKAIHHWVNKQKGKPTECEECKLHFTGRKIHWANISGDYLKDVTDWKRLCAKCHYIFDEQFKRKERKSV